MEQTKLAEWINRLIAEDKLYKFYKSKLWLTLRREILAANHFECELCKRNECKGERRYSRATTVHHVQFVKKYPELALSRTFTHGGKEYKNLMALCDGCHNKMHKRFAKKEAFNKEKW